MIELSENLLMIAFIVYLAAIPFFGGAIRQKNISKGKKSLKSWVTVAMIMTVAGFAAHLGYFITRWLAAGFAPVSNLFEFITFFGWCIVAAFILIFYLYKPPALGLAVMPVVVILLAYAGMFSGDITPLIPPLQTHWLQIHVITTALGQAILAISFASALILLIKKVDQTKRNISNICLEAILFFIISVIGFIFVTVAFNALDYSASFQRTNQFGAKETIEYKMPPVIGPNEGKLTAGQFEPILEAPAIIDAKKLNTVIWSFSAGIILYILMRIILRKRIGAALKPLTGGINEELVDEISYRSVLIGFPIFTLGALVFGMIWAQIAWSRFWGWDPKEVWALITWLFYAAFLHLRLSRGWHGERSAWLAVIGFGIIMFNLVAVNLVIKGLHSYAGL